MSGALLSRKRCNGGLLFGVGEGLRGVDQDVTYMEQRRRVHGR